MKIELRGGPADGALYEVPDATKIWIIPYLRTDVAAFHAADPTLENVVVPVEEGTHAYGLSTALHGATGVRFFDYIGERAIK